MDKYIYKIITAVFVLAFLLPIKAFAQSNDSFELDTQGNVTLYSNHAAREGISSLQFKLIIDSKTADKVEFQFSPGIAKVSEFRYHKDTGFLNVYIAGTEALFAENEETLSIGKVVVLDASQNNTPAKISVDAKSLKYVYGTKLRQDEELQVQVPETPVLINDDSNDSGGAQIPPAEDGSQGFGGSSSGSQGTDDSKNTQSQGNSNLSGNTASNSQNAASSSQNTTSDTQSSGSNASDKQPQSSGSNGVGSTPLAENYTRLKQTFENAQGFKKEDYSSESYEALQAAMAKAEEVLGDPYAASREIDEALIELENAIGALVKKEKGEQGIGETSGQTVDVSSEREKNDAFTGSILSMFLLIAGILVFVGCVALVVLIKIRNRQNYEDD